MSPYSYRRSQAGGGILLALTAALAVVLLAAGSAEAWMAAGITGLAVVPIVATFVTMTVTVDAAEVVVRFGIGLLRKRIPLSDIAAATITRTRWYNGVGIRLLPHGWLYNVAIGPAVELQLGSGSRVLIGTSDPAGLLAAIEAARAAIASPASTPPGDTRAGPGVKWIFAIVIPILVAVAASIYYQSRSMSVSVGAEGVSVQSGFYSARIPINDLREVIVADSLPRIRRRTNGFAFGDARRGHFTLDSLGRALLFVTLDAPPYVVLKTEDRTVIISFRDPAKAKVLVTNLSRLSGN